MNDAGRDVSKAVSKLQRAAAWLFTLYLLCLFGLLPFYFEKGYANITYAKWFFYRTITFFVDLGRWGILPGLMTLSLLLLAAVALLTLFQGGKRFLAQAAGWFRELPPAPRLVFGFMIASLLSFAFSDQKQLALWGYEGWCLGLMSQLAFAVSFFLARWSWRGKDHRLWVLITGVLAVTCSLALLHRFRIDVIGIFQRPVPKGLTPFQSTLGHANFYGAFLALLLPLPMFLFLSGEHFWGRFGAGLTCALGFMSCLSAGTDGIKPALAGAFLWYLIFSLEERTRLNRWLELFVLCLGSFCLLGVLRRIFPEQAVVMEPLDSFLCGSALIWVLFFIAAAALVWLRRGRPLLLKKCGISRPDSKKRILKNPKTVLLAVICIGMAAVIVYIVLNTLGLVPEAVSLGGYFRMNDSWGTHRGFLWNRTLRVFWERLLHDPIRALFGSGPDTWVLAVTKRYPAEIIAEFRRRELVTSAHNEWLTMLINEGLTGMLLYIGIFMSSLKSAAKGVKEDPGLMALGACIIGYTAFGFFSFQQVVTTPAVFVLMGFAAAHSECIRKKQG